MQFQLIKGGKTEECSFEFLEGKVTDTRLMGVLGLFARYYDREESREYQYLLYYDIEEIGLDHIDIHHFDNQTDIDLAIKSSFGGLGAKLVDLNSKEVEYLVYDFVKKTKGKRQSLPSNITELSFIYDKKTELSELELENLNSKLCTSPLNVYAVAHYYLMRGFGKDEDGVSLLRDKSSPKSNFDDLSFIHHATFLKNKIEDFVDESGKNTFLCESLIESNNNHYLIISELEVRGEKVVLAKKKSQMKLSLQEASLMLTRGEYVTVFEILCPMEIFDADFALYSTGFTKTLHETGEMFMQFKPNNDHVNGREFNLSDDVLGVYYSTDYGQLILGAYSFEDITMLEDRLYKSELGVELCPIAKYQFMQSIVYEFAISGFTDFAQFLDNME